MVRWWRLALLVAGWCGGRGGRDGAGVAVNVATGGTARWFPAVQRHPLMVDRRGDGGRGGRVVAGVGGAAVV